jgi:hypothetical protein
MTAGVGRVLIRHSFGRFFDRESLAPQGDPQASLAQLLGILAVPGSFFVLLFRPLTLRGWDLVYCRYLFLSFSMITMAMIVVLCWDALFPDRRDYQILTPLPVRLWQLFAAKLAALGMLLAVFLVDINFFTVLMWPGIDGGDDLPAIFSAHAASLAGGGLFTASAMGGIQGVLVTVLSGAALRRAVALAQTLLVGFLVALFFATPLLAVSVKRLILAGSSVPYWFPPYWFLGLYERLRPATRNQTLMHLGDLALWALGLAALLFLLTYVPGYRRHARKTLETPAGSAHGPGPLARLLAILLNRTLISTPMQRAVFHFINQTITRSAKHRYFLAAYGGLGAALALMNIADHSGVVRVSLTLSFILVSGLRAAFNFPSELAANWGFQISAADVEECGRAMRKWVMVCALGPLFAIVGAVEIATFGAFKGLFYAGFGLSLSLLLVEVMFFGFRKVPFTCSYFPGKFNLTGLSVIYVFGFTAYSSVMSGVAKWLSSHPDWMPAFAIVVALSLFGLRCLRNWRRRPAEVAYEDTSDPIVRTLGVASRSGGSDAPGTRLDEVLPQCSGGRRRELQRASGRGHRLPRSERVG